MKLDSCEYMIGTRPYGRDQQAFQCATKEEYIERKEADPFTASEKTSLGSVLLLFMVFLAIVYFCFLFNKSIR